MSRFVISMNDGSVAVMEIIPQPRVRRNGRTVMVMSKPDAEIARWPEKERAKVVSVKEINEGDIPTSRDFRDAWKLSGNRIDHDMGKAREIHMKRIRRERNRRLRELDVETIKAVGSGMIGARDVEAKKQALRDVPQHVEGQLKQAATVADLKVIWPDELK